RGAHQARVDRGHAGVVGGDVVAVAHVVLAPAGTAVGLPHGIEVAAGAAAVGRAAVAVLVHVEAVLAARRQAVDLAGDGDAALDRPEDELSGHRVALGGGEHGDPARQRRGAHVGLAGGGGAGGAGGAVG